MDLGSVLLGVALLVVVVFIAVRPLLEQQAFNDQPATLAEQLINSRERVLVQLRDLDFDEATGKINADDYASQRAKLVAEGVAILKQLDALGVTSDEAETSSAGPDEAIEAAVARKRAERAPAGLAESASLAASSAKIEAAVARAQRAASQPAVPGRKPGATAPKGTVAPARSKANGRDLEAEMEANVAQRRSKAPGAGPAGEAGSQMPTVKADGKETPPAVEGLSGPAAHPDAHALNCARCGTPVQPGDLYCSKCGSPQTVACGHCGRVARAGDQFCAQCGQALPASLPGKAKA